MISARLAFGYFALLVKAALPQEDTWERLIVRGDALEYAGDYTGAAACYRTAAKSVEPSQNIRLALTLNALANCEDQAGHYAAAEPNYRRALALAEANAGKRSPEYALVLVSFGLHYAAQDRLGTAERMLRDGVATYIATVPPDDSRLAMARTRLADVFISNQRFHEAEQLLREALIVLQTLPDRYRPQVAIGLSNLGWVSRQLGQPDRATQLMHEAVDLIEQTYGSNHPFLIHPLNNLADIQVSAGRLDEARAGLNRALRIAAFQLGTDHPDYGRLLLRYADLERRSGHKGEAKSLQAQGRAILKNNGQSNGIGMTVDVSALRRN